MPGERAHYRVRYPRDARPALRVQGHEFSVLDLSEGGLRFELGKVAPPQCGLTLQGTVVLRNGETTPVSGEIVWVNHEQAAVRFDAPIPARVIRQQQHALLNRRGMSS